MKTPLALYPPGAGLRGDKTREEDVVKTYTVGSLQTDLGGSIRPVIDCSTGRSIGVVSSDAGPALIGELSARDFLAEYGYDWPGAHHLIRELPDGERQAAWERVPD